MMNFFSPKKKKPEQVANQLRILIEATYNGWTCRVIKVAESGINLNTRSEKGITALHVASQASNKDMVKLLIKLGADVNSRESKYLSTPLHFAAMKGTLITVQNLIKVKNALADRGCEIGDALLTADFKRTAETYKDIIVALVKNGADLNAKDTNGRTPLHLAIYYRSDSVKTLLGLGADVDSQDNEGRLPWHYAMQEDNHEGLRWLLAFGADINDFNMFRQSDLKELNVMLKYRNSKMKYLIIDQLTRLRAANLFISRIYPIYDGESSRNYYNDCMKEVRKMEFYEIEDGVSIYDLLHMSPKRKAAYTKPTDRTNNLLIECESEFPNYYGIIRASFLDENKRKPLLKAAKSAWYQLTEISLPDVCVEHILSYLNSCYLKIMIYGAEYF